MYYDYEDQLRLVNKIFYLCFFYNSAIKESIIINLIYQGYELQNIPLI